LFPSARERAALFVFLFISAPVKYGDRAKGINAGPMGSFDSLALHGVLMRQIQPPLTYWNI